MVMTLSPRSFALGTALAFALATPALAASPGATPTATPAPAGATAGPQSAPAAVTATTPQNGSAQVAQTGGNDQESVDEGPGQQHHANGPDNEQEGEQNN